MKDANPEVSGEGHVAFPIDVECYVVRPHIGARCWVYSCGQSHSLGDGLEHPREDRRTLACKVARRLRQSGHGGVFVSGVYAEIRIYGLIGSCDQWATLSACSFNKVGYDANVKGGDSLVKGKSTVSVGRRVRAGWYSLGKGAVMNSSHSVPTGREGDGVISNETRVRETVQRILKTGLGLGNTTRSGSGCVNTATFHLNVWPSTSSNSHYGAQSYEIRHCRTISIARQVIMIGWLGGERNSLDTLSLMK